MTGRYTYVSRDNLAPFYTLLVFISLTLLAHLVGCYNRNAAESRRAVQDSYGSRKPETNANPTPEPSVKIMYSGQVSYYSHEGCIGCNENQIMGNGQPFDENAMTLAIPCEDVKTQFNPDGIRYGTVVKVLNDDTHQQEEATITDCGGFSKYDRVADLSLGLAQKIGAKTDLSNITIYIKE